MAPTNKNDSGSHFIFSYGQVSIGIRLASIICLGMLTLFLLVLTMGAIKAYPNIGDSSANGTQNTISVTGEADMDVSPDVTVFSWTAQADGKTVQEAQTQAAIMNNKAISYVKGKGIAAADIKTTSYNTETKYDTNYRPCVVPLQSSGKAVNTSAAVAPSAVSSAGGSSGSGYTAPAVLVPPCGSQSVPTGYTTYNTVEVKVRNIDKNPALTGELIAGLGQIGVKVSGPTNTIDNPDTFKNAVRAQAIQKARQQAEVLAAQLGVKLVRVTSFNENNYPYYPTAYAMGAANKSADSEAVAPEISAGTNKVTSQVTITYEIR